MSPVHAIGIGCVVVALSGAGAAGSLIDEDFESYTPGLEPVGPTITELGTGAVTVESSPLGFTSQALVVDAPQPSDFAAASYGFAPHASGVLTVEVQVSISVLSRSLFLGTAADTGALWTRLLANDDGSLLANVSAGPAVAIGSYSPNQPFGVRLELDLDAFEWSVTIDDELDGFADDVATTGLSPTNAPAALPNVAAVSLSLNPIDSSAPPPTMVAYDNLRVIPAPGVLGVLGWFGAVCGRRRSRGDWGGSGRH